MTDTTRPDLIGSKEVCATLGVDRSTLTRWVAAGRITPAMKLAGRTGAYLFRPDDIEQVAREVSAVA